MRRSHRCTRAWPATTITAARPVERRFVLVVVGLVLAGLAGCGGSRQPQDTAQVIELAQMQDRVREYAHAVIAQIGVASPPPETRVGPSPCSDNIQRDPRYEVVGNWQLPLPAQQHLPTFRRLRDQWRAQNYKITEYREIPGGVTATLSAADPATHLSICLTGTDPPQAVALIVASDCVRTPEGSYPHR